VRFNQKKLRRKKLKMRVKVKMLGLLKKACGKPEVSMELDENSRLKDVISKIIEESKDLKNLLLDPELKDPRPNTIILVNGKEISVLSGLETEIEDGDEITIIPIIHGG